jgi:hypothetical protein
MDDASNQPLSSTPIPATPGSQPETPSSNAFKNLFGVIFSPQPTFEAINRKPNWLLPMALITILSLLFMVVILHFMGMERMMRSGLGTNPTEQQIQQVDLQIKAFQERPGLQAFFYLPVAIGSLLLPLVVGGVLMLVFTLAGGSTTFKKALSVVSHSFFASTLVTTVFSAGLLMITTDYDKFDIQNPVASNLGFFLNPAEMSKFLYHIATSIDLLSFWLIFLMATGFTVVSENLKKKTAYTCLIVIWAVWVLGKAGIMAALGK